VGIYKSLATILHVQLTSKPSSQLSVLGFSYRHSEISFDVIIYGNKWRCKSTHVNRVFFYTIVIRKRIAKTHITEGFVLSFLKCVFQLLQRL
jgi:hypothetical protein